jgi:hypothetical protein
MLTGGLLLEYVKLSEQNIFLLQGVSHAVVLLPPLYYLRDDRVDREVQNDDDLIIAQKIKYDPKNKNMKSISVTKQIFSIWETIQDGRVYSLVYFLFVVGSMPNAGSSFTNFLLGPLKFSDMMYMTVGLVGILCSTIGIFAYKVSFTIISFTNFIVLQK